MTCLECHYVRAEVRKESPWAVPVCSYLGCVIQAGSIDNPREASTMRGMDGCEWARMALVVGDSQEIAAGMGKAV